MKVIINTAQPSFFFFIFVPLFMKSRGQRVPLGLEWSALFVLEKHDLFFLFSVNVSVLFWNVICQLCALRSTLFPYTTLFRSDYSNILLNGSWRTIEGECLPEALCLSPETRCQFNSVVALHLECNIFAVSVLTSATEMPACLHTYTLYR